MLCLFRTSVSEAGPDLPESEPQTPETLETLKAYYGGLNNFPFYFLGDAPYYNYSRIYPKALLQIMKAPTSFSPGPPSRVRLRWTKDL